MKYFMLAGEASGDLHGSNLAKAILSLNPSVHIKGWGGDQMQEAGVEISKHYRELAFMGFIEVIKNIRTIRKNFKICKEQIKIFQPDVLILIDYPGFNLRMAKWAKKNELKVVYYISPQVWAWKEKRVELVKKYTDRMLVILPFEKEFYRQRGIEVDYVGHPLMEAIQQFNSEVSNHKIDYPPKHAREISPDKKIIALLPGSRKQEIKAKLPVMLETSRFFPDYQFVVAKAPGLDEHFYDELLHGYDNVTHTSNQTYALLSKAEAALVTSGTATLETALFGVPEIVCYKGSPISYRIAKWLINIPYISLVNLIMQKEVVKELIQDECSALRLRDELSKLLFDEAKKEQIKKEYADLKSLLTSGGKASENAASIIQKISQPLTKK